MRLLRNLPISISALFVLTIWPCSALADSPLQVQITIQGDETFPDRAGLSGQINWVAVETFVITPGLYTFSVGFQYTDPDNIPIDPLVSELSLLDWPPEFGVNESWEFIHTSTSLDCPLNSWQWRVEITIDPEDTLPSFQTGETIATADWSTAGDDIDDTADNSGFSMKASVRKLVWLPQPIFPNPTGGPTGTMGTLFSNSDEHMFNPEPIPEPSTLVLLLPLVASMVCRRR